MAETKEFISKRRLDALTDGVFAFAMTLLVINLDLPEHFHPTSAAELISALLGLGGTSVAYVITYAETVADAIADTHAESNSDSKPGQDPVSLHRRQPVRKDLRIQNSV